MKKRCIQFFSSYEEADKCHLEEVLRMDPNDRLVSVNEIRKSIYGMSGIVADNIVDKKHITFGKR